MYEKHDPFVNPNPTIIPQNYPLWVEEWVSAGKGYFTYRPIVGWVWTSDEDSNPYLHPVVAVECGAHPFEPRPDRDWAIVDHKQPPESEES